MKKEITINVPDIGDFEKIPVIEILVQPGETITKDDSLIVLESDKATMEVPSPENGRVTKILLKTDDSVSKGDAILHMEITESDTREADQPGGTPPKTTSSDSSTKNVKAENSQTVINSDIHAEVVVLGSGPGGYTAAFRAADLGKNVLIIERYTELGGVCLNVGCIPSKALLHAAKVITDAQDIRAHGIIFQDPKIDIGELKSWKNEVVANLTKGLKTLAKKRNVNILTGIGKFSSENTLSVTTPLGEKTVSFDYAIIAAGSSSAKLSGIPYEDPRVIDSTGALKLDDIPKNLLVVGGGIIGLEMAAVYHGLGSKVTIAELTDGLIPEADRDLITPLQNIIEKRYNSVRLKTKVENIAAKQKKLAVTLSNSNSKVVENFDKVLVSIGRTPNGDKIDAKAAGVETKRGFVLTDNQMRTNVPHIFAIGDIVGQPMLAHKASHEGKLCAEIIAGNDKAEFDSMGIPSVAYTDPEVAWVGMTEKVAKEQKIPLKKSVFPWAASGRAQASARKEGITKLLFNRDTQKLIGAGIVGINAGELISEAVLAIEMGADSEDIGLTIHPHPTLAETILFSAEIAEETITDLYLGKKI